MFNDPDLAYEDKCIADYEDHLRLLANELEIMLKGHGITLEPKTLQVIADYISNREDQAYDLTMDRVAEMSRRKRDDRTE